MSLRGWCTSVHSHSTVAAEPSLTWRTLSCRLLSFRDAFVSFPVPSELSAAINAHIVPGCSASVAVIL